MKPRHILGPALAVALLAGGALAADDLKSGPQPGQRLAGPFHPLNVTGPGAGQKVCQV
jgi:hypothetical protein